MELEASGSGGSPPSVQAAVDSTKPLTARFSTSPAKVVQENLVQPSFREFSKRLCKRRNDRIVIDLGVKRRLCLVITWLRFSWLFHYHVPSQVDIKAITSTRLSEGFAKQCQDLGAEWQLPEYRWMEQAIFLYCSLHTLALSSPQPDRQLSVNFFEGQRLRGASKSDYNSKRTTGTELPSIWPSELDNVKKRFNLLIVRSILKSESHETTYQLSEWLMDQEMSLERA